MDAKLEDLFRRRFRQRQQDLATVMRDSLRMLDEELAGTGMLNSGVRVRRTADTVIEYIESVGCAARSEIAEILEADQPRYTRGLAAEIGSLIEWALPNGVGLRVLRDHVANMKHPPLEHSESRIRAAQERALRQGRTDAELFALRRRAEERVPWYSRPGVPPALITSAAVILTGLLPLVLDAPWRLVSGHEQPEEVRETRVLPPVPDSLAVRLGTNDSAIAYQELVAALSDESTTALHKSTFKNSMNGRAVAWAGVLVSAHRVELPFGGHYVEARICPIPEMNATAEPELVTVRFRDDQRGALAAVPLEAGVLFSGKLYFHEHLKFPWIVEAELITHWAYGARQDDTVSGLPN